MVNTIISGHIFEIERVDPFEAANIVTILMGIGTPLVMGVNTADRAEVVFGSFGIEFIEFQRILTLEELNPRQRHRANHCALTATDRAIATAWIFDAIRQ
jgi:hypothetical protein